MLFKRISGQNNTWSVLFISDFFAERSKNKSRKIRYKNRKQQWKNKQRMLYK